jgi:hypothetical protein
VCGDDDKTTLNGGAAKKLDGAAMAKLGGKWFSTSLTIGVCHLQNGLKLLFQS